jgi:hypothetical protein
MRIECRRAVGTHDSQVFKPVVVADPVDVVDDQRHSATAPHLVLTAHFAAARFQPVLVQPILQFAAGVGRAFDEYLLERDPLRRGTASLRPIRVELGR